MSALVLGVFAALRACLLAELDRRDVAGDRAAYLLAARRCADAYGAVVGAVDALSRAQRDQLRRVLPLHDTLGRAIELFLDGRPDEASAVLRQVLRGDYSGLVPVGGRQ